MLNLNCTIKVYETEALKPSGRVYQFTHVRDIAIKSSYKKFTDTAIITMPKSVVTNAINDALGIELAKRSPIDFEQRSIHEFFKIDNYIEVFLGYNGEEKPAFRGYIREVKGDAPVQIFCDDMMYYLKKYKMVDIKKSTSKEEDKKNVITSNKSEKVKNPIEALKKRLEKLEIPFVDPPTINTEQLGEVIIDRQCNIVEFLKVLREKFGVYSYFRLEESKEGNRGGNNKVYKSNLYITNNPYQYQEGEINTFLEKYKNTEEKVPLSKKILKRAISITGVGNVLNLFQESETYIGEGRLRFHYNIIRDNLKIKKEEVNKVRVRAEIFYKNSNVAIPAEIGDADGRLVKKYVYHNNEEELNFDDSNAYQEREKEIKGRMKVIAGLKLGEFKQTGLTGNVLTFGEPFMRPLDSISLEQAEDKEKQGVFLVEEVERTYGIDGYRQRITLGRQLNKKEA